MRHLLPHPTLRERMSGYGESVLNAAACVLVLVLARTTVMSSTGHLRQQGEQAIRNHYAAHLEPDLLEELL